LSIPPRGHFAADHEIEEVLAMELCNDNLLAACIVRCVSLHPPYRTNLVNQSTWLMGADVPTLFQILFFEV
jgi:hypothetical protein